LNFIDESLLKKQSDHFAVGVVGRGVGLILRRKALIEVV